VKREEFEKQERGEKEEGRGKRETLPTPVLSFL
jgi:hypothetical protein